MQKLSEILTKLAAILGITLIPAAIAAVSLGLMTNSGLIAATSLLAGLGFMWAVKQIAPSNAKASNSRYAAGWAAFIATAYFWIENPYMPYAFLSLAVFAGIIIGNYLF